MPSITITVKRDILRAGDWGTPSDVTISVSEKLSLDGEPSQVIASYEFAGMELPWRENTRNISCIPTGTYLARRIHHGRFGTCYLLMDVPGRSSILFGHIGNYAGDLHKGYSTNSEGCLLLGMSHGILKPNGREQLSVVASKKAIISFQDILRKHVSEGAIVRVLDGERLGK